MGHWTVAMTEYTSSNIALKIILGLAPQLTAPCVTQTDELNDLVILVSVPCPGIRKVTIGAPTDFLV